MKRKITIVSFIFCLAFVLVSFNNSKDQTPYEAAYFNKLHDFQSEEMYLSGIIESAQLNDTNDINRIKEQIQLCRNKMKGIDFWLRYLEPVPTKASTDHCLLNGKPKYSRSLKSPTGEMARGLHWPHFIWMNPISKKILYNI